MLDNTYLHIEDEKAIKQFLGKRFGMFIHWGVYSSLGGEWNNRTVEDDIGEWIMNVLHIPIKEYEKIAAAFNPIDFDADALVKLAYDAGMRYIVITTKHHDGFAMFHSDNDPYNIIDWTDYKHDVIDELAKACKKYGMKLGFYYSQALDWHEEHAGGWDSKNYGSRESWANVWDFPDNDRKDFGIFFEKKVKPQVMELLTKYGEVFLMWFDTPRTITTEQSEELYQLVKSIQPNCLINTRIGNGKGDYGSLKDNQIPAVVLEKPNEAPVTLNDTWGYKHYDHNWKTSNEIIEMLIKLASRNVNFLLNIGPMGNGRLTNETVEILNGISEWTALNDDAIYNTSGNPTSSDFDWGYVTACENRIYICFKEDKVRTIEFNGLKSQVRRVCSLATKKDICFKQLIDEKNEILTLKLDIPKTYMYMPVFVVECFDTPEFDGYILQQDDSLLLYPLKSRIFDGYWKDAKSIMMENNYDHLSGTKVDSGGILTNWSKSDVYLQWEAKFTGSGIYSVEIITRSAEISDKARLKCELEIILSNANHLKTGLKKDYIYSDSRTSSYNTRIGTVCGNIELRKAGLHTIELRLVKDLEDERDSIPFVALRFVQLQR